MTTLQTLLQQGQIALQPVSETPLQETRTILSYLLKVPLNRLFNYHEIPVSETLLKRFRHLLSQRLSHKPLQYILHQAWFYKYPFYVDERVLIPRPETEFLVASALNFIQKLKAPTKGWSASGGNSLPRQVHSKAGQQLIVADIGTGCGALAITLALELLNLETVKRRNVETTLYATDVSSSALQIARINAKQLLTNNEANSYQLTFLKGSLLDPLPQPANIILTNLPYIPTDRIPHLQPEVKDSEPRVALDGGEDGFQLYRRLFSQLPSKWQSPGLFLAEIDYTQRHTAAQIFQQSVPQARAEVIIDPLNKQPFLLAQI